MNTEDMQEKAAEQYSARLAQAKRSTEIHATEFHKLTDALRNGIPNPSEYEKNRAAYIEYLLMCVRLGDWHGVSDAANDLRVLEAREGK